MARLIFAVGTSLAAAMVMAAPAQPITAAEQTAVRQHVFWIRDKGLMYYRGNQFRLGTLTIANLERYCAGISVAREKWRLPSSAELAPMVGFLNQKTGQHPAIRTWWRSFWSPAPPGYILPTTTANAGLGYTDTRRVFYISVYKYEVLGSQFISQLRSDALTVIGPDAESTPLTDGYGNTFPVQVICVANES